MPPSVLPSPPASPTPVSTRSARRRWAAGLLFLGAVLAAVGLFLPWVRVVYPYINEIDRGGTSYDMPGPGLAQALLAEVTAPDRFSPAMPLLALLVFGAPLCFAVLAAMAVLRRHWLPGRRVRWLGVALALIGGIVTILDVYALVSIVGWFDAVRATRTPLPGAAVTLLGYLCALIGATLLPARSSAAAR